MPRSDTSSMRRRSRFPVCCGVIDTRWFLAPCLLFRHRGTVCCLSMPQWDCVYAGSAVSQRGLPWRNETMDRKTGSRSYRLSQTIPGFAGFVTTMSLSSVLCSLLSVWCSNCRNIFGYFVTDDLMATGIIFELHREMRLYPFHDDESSVPFSALGM